jgi:formate dehydrogenase major subunit
VRSLITKQFGIPFEEASSFLAGLLKKMHFDKVFDFSFAADLNGGGGDHRVLTRQEKGVHMPQFTSCCPGWVNFVERRYPEIIPHLPAANPPR